MKIELNKEIEILKKVQTFFILEIFNMSKISLENLTNRIGKGMYKLWELEEKLEELEHSEHDR